MTIEQPHERWHQSGEQKTKNDLCLLIQKQPDNRRGWKAERCQVIEILSAFGEMPLKGRKNIFWKRAACDGIKGSNKFIYLKKYKSCK